MSLEQPENNLMAEQNRDLPLPPDMYPPGDFAVNLGEVDVDALRQAIFEARKE